RRHILQAEEHAGRQLHPVGHEPVAAVRLRVNPARADDQRGGEQQGDDVASHVSSSQKLCPTRYTRAGTARACGFFARNNVPSATIDNPAATKNATRYSPVAT